MSRAGHHIAVYNGKVVVMDYIANPRDEFKRAAQRIADNGAEGFVITPAGEVFTITRSSRKAKRASAKQSAEVIKQTEV